MTRRTFLKLTGAAALFPLPVLGAAAGESGMFERAEASGATHALQRVFFHRPAQWRADGRVVMVMHGVKRNADRYRDDWAPLADAHGFLLLCPEFSAAKFPGSNWYNYGGMLNTDDPEQRAFAVPDRVFVDVKARFAASAERFSLYGHSAGSQFVHRFLLLAPSARVDQAISANAGWYTLPVSDQPFPYGLQNTAVSEAQVQAFLRRPLVLQLGEADIDPNHSSLRRNETADRQGLHRFARGLNFLEVGKREARRRGIELAWRLVTVPGVGHSNARMAASAAKVLFS
jgi:poly(3-hydroxybutyrate) depolymerase